MSEQKIVTLAYQGWCNRETWLGNLWLCNDEELYRLFCRALREHKSSLDIAAFIEQELRWQLEGEIKTASLWQDLLSVAFDRIDWVEIVSNNVDDMQQGQI